MATGVAHADPSGPPARIGHFCREVMADMVRVIDAHPVRTTVDTSDKPITVYALTDPSKTGKSDVVQTVVRTDSPDWGEHSPVTVYASTNYRDDPKSYPHAQLGTLRISLFSKPTESGIEHTLLLGGAFFYPPEKDHEGNPESPNTVSVGGKKLKPSDYVGLLAMKELFKNKPTAKLTKGVLEEIVNVGLVSSLHLARVQHQKEHPGADLPPDVVERVVRESSLFKYYESLARIRGYRVESLSLSDNFQEETLSNMIQRLASDEDKRLLQNEFWRVEKKNNSNLKDTDPSFLTSQTKLRTRFNINMKLVPLP